MASWRTTVAGILSLIGLAIKGIGQGKGNQTIDMIGDVLVALSAGGGLLFARDQKAHEEGK